MTAADRWPDADADERAFADEFRDPIAALEARTSGCPPVDRLLAADAGVLPDPMRREVDEHRERCELCRQTLRDLREVTAGEPEHAAIARVRALVGTSPRLRRRARWDRPTVLAVAASLAVVLVTSGWAVALLRQNRLLQFGVSSNGQTAVARLQTELEAERARRLALEGQIARLEADAARPVVNVPLIDLEPLGALRSGTAPHVQLPASARLVTLVLATGARSANREFDIEILDAQSRVTWPGAGLRETSFGTVTLVVPRLVMPPGLLTVRLYSGSGSARALAYEYRFELQVTP